jgi:hypothetical protein
MENRAVSSSLCRARPPFFSIAGGRQTARRTPYCSKTATEDKRSETTLTPLQQTLWNQRHQLADFLVAVVLLPPPDRVVRLAPPAVLLVREEGGFGFWACASVSARTKRAEGREGA